MALGTTTTSETHNLDALNTGGNADAALAKATLESGGDATSGDHSSKNGLSIQDVLSFGYVYVLILGIVSNSILYGMLGVNIISYSTVLDVLLSPLVHMTENLLFPSVVLGVPAIAYPILKYLKKRTFKKFAKLKPGDKKYEKTKKEIALHNKFSLPQIWMAFSAYIIFGMFIGYGWGGGSKMQDRINEPNGNPDASHTITFAAQADPQGNDTQRTIEVELIGTTSGYIFYIERGASEVSVAPIADNVIKIERLREDD